MMAALLGQSTGPVHHIESYRQAVFNVFTSRQRRLIEQRIERYERDGHRSYNTENLVPFLNRLDLNGDQVLTYIELLGVLWVSGTDEIFGEAESLIPWLMNPRETSWTI